MHSQSNNAPLAPSLQPHKSLELLASHSEISQVENRSSSCSCSCTSSSRKLAGAMLARQTETAAKVYEPRASIGCLTSERALVAAQPRDIVFQSIFSCRPSTQESRCWNSAQNDPNKTWQKSHGTSQNRQRTSFIRQISSAPTLTSLSTRCHSISNNIFENGFSSDFYVESNQPGSYSALSQSPKAVSSSFHKSSSSPTLNLFGCGSSVSSKKSNECSQSSRSNSVSTSRCSSSPLLPIPVSYANSIRHSGHTNNKSLVLFPQSTNLNSHVCSHVTIDVESPSEYNQCFPRKCLSSSLTHREAENASAIFLMLRNFVDRDCARTILDFVGPVNLLNVVRLRCFRMFTSCVFSEGSCHATPQTWPCPSV